ncbi:MAG: phage tail assembly chaperone [Pseudoprimorskyibacter sp.]|nr:phage tail assembly chaperone [Pseudoprimorskyibacter sp.]
MSNFDWPALMRLGLRDLGLAPEVFWLLTPQELQILIGADRVPPVMTRARLDALAVSYPDISQRETVP